MTIREQYQNAYREYRRQYHRRRSLYGSWRTYADRRCRLIDIAPRTMLAAEQSLMMREVA